MTSFSRDIYEPLDDLSNLSPSARETSQFANARIDWKETPESHVFEADLPGLEKEEVKVEVEEGSILRISGERKMEQEENDKWHRIDRSSGKFLWRFRLPNNADVEEVETSMKNGVLTVTLPKEEMPMVNHKGLRRSNAWREGRARGKVARRF